VHGVTQGTDAQAEVTVRLIDDTGNVYGGHGVDADTLTASAKAYINALNRLLEQRAEEKIPYTKSA
jgi:2-isopropylmalate synthase